MAFATATPKSVLLREAWDALWGGPTSRRRLGRKYAAHVAFPVIKALGPHVSVSTGGTVYLVSTRDPVIGKATFREGSYDRAEMSRAIQLLGEMTGEPQPLRDRVLVDVGANIGTTTLPALLEHRARLVLALEPEPQAFRLFRCNVILNSLEERVIAVNAAASSASGVLTLEVSDTNQGDHRVRVVKADGLFGEALRRTIPVAATTIDAELDSHDLRPSDLGLAWLDAQGFESHVLEGAAKVIEHGTPLHFEFWPYGLRRTGGTEDLSRLTSEYRLFDVRASLKHRRAVEVTSLHQLADRLGESDHTDILAVAKRRSGSSTSSGSWVR